MELQQGCLQAAPGRTTWTGAEPFAGASVSVHVSEYLDSGELAEHFLRLEFEGQLSSPPLVIASVMTRITAPGDDQQRVGWRRND